MSVILQSWEEYRNNHNNSSTTLFEREFAQYMDKNSVATDGYQDFDFPKFDCPERSRCIYLCGNSLGLRPKSVPTLVQEHLDKWATEAVEGHFTQPNQWLTVDDCLIESMSRLVGAKPSEVVIMNTLTANLHFMMAAFYRPTAERHMILIEGKSFPSDYHAVVSQIQHHGFDPNVSLLEVFPREGETCLREEDIEAVILEKGQHIALTLLSGVQYYTGQFFDIKRITEVAHSQGCVAGWDLAHAVGNVPLHLHEWNIDFACWCTYKYLNSGPGCAGACFVHEHHNTTAVSDVDADKRFKTLEVPRLAGWWGHRVSDRFVMNPEFIPSVGASGFRVSNVNPLLVACVRASLDVFDKVRQHYRISY